MHRSLLRIHYVTLNMHDDVGTAIVLCITPTHGALTSPLQLHTANPLVPTADLLPAFRLKKHHLQSLHFTNSNTVVMATPIHNDDVPSHRSQALDSTLRTSTQFPPLVSMYKTHTTSLRVLWSVHNSTTRQTVNMRIFPRHCNCQHSHLMSN